MKYNTLLFWVIKIFRYLFTCFSERGRFVTIPPGSLFPKYLWGNIKEIKGKDDSKGKWLNCSSSEPFTIGIKIIYFFKVQILLWDECMFVMSCKHVFIKSLKVIRFECTLIIHSLTSFLLVLPWRGRLVEKKSLSSVPLPNITKHRLCSIVLFNVSIMV